MGKSTQYTFAQVRLVQRYKKKSESDYKRQRLYTKLDSPVRRIRTNHKAGWFICQNMYCLQNETFVLNSSQCKLKIKILRFKIIMEKFYLINLIRRI